MKSIHLFSKLISNAWFLCSYGKSQKVRIESNTPPFEKLNIESDCSMNQELNNVKMSKIGHLVSGVSLEDYESYFFMDGSVK